MYYSDIRNKIIDNLKNKVYVRKNHEHDRMLNFEQQTKVPLESSIEGLIAYLFEDV